MSLLLHGDCLEHMKGIDTDSVDFIFCDLPYGQTSCKWDCCIDLDKFWIEVMRIKKINTPIFMTTTTKFGVSLINSAPKKCPFRYDLVWVKSAPAGFLSAKKMPMRKHEMVYVFYEKLPFYDLSSHSHKFLKPNTPMGEKPDMYGRLWDKNGKPYVKEKQHSQYTPPLPVSVIKGENNTYNTEGRKKPITREPPNKYDPPLPVSVVKEECKIVKRTDEGCNGLYGKEENKVFIYDKDGKLRNSEPRYDPPLPTSMLEIKSTRGKHSTEKPVALMEWLLKYYSKEGDVVLDPTMGSGSTGVACKNMNRNFIGIEKDPEIYEVAVNRID
eukprot:COSAG02_NODE_313_length_24939_cov_470.394485_28_plen_327_part_00